MRAKLTFDSVGPREAEIEIPFAPAIGSRIMLGSDGPSIISVPDTVAVKEELIVKSVGWDTRTDTLVLDCCEVGKKPGQLESPEVFFDE
jgi:hypothetical protein